jgi:multimeric flavodoxin WrbA
MRKPLVLGIAGSNRSRANVEKLLDVILRAETYTEMQDEVNKLSKSKQLSNTECILASALFGAWKQGADIEILKLRDVFPPYEPFNPREIDKKFYEVFERANGICLSTPVYFGDRSSYINSFFSILNKVYGRYAMDGKVVGVVSSGAKRNGGQETTNIYTLYDCLRMGATVVSNGSPTSQYGGTAWAGDVGVASEDEFGMATSFGTGRNIAKALTLLQNQEKRNTKLRVGVLITSDTPHGILKNYLQKLLDSAEDAWDCEFNIIDLTSFKFKRCKACKTCPHLGDKKIYKPQQYGCIISDDLIELHRKIIKCDTFIIARYQNTIERDITDVYQVFIERFRFVRRDNYQLAFAPLTMLSIEDQWSKDLFFIRVVTSFIRHNMMIVGPPLVSITDNGRNIIENENLHFNLHRFLTYSSKIVMSKKKFKIKGENYIAIGYGDFEGKVAEDLFKTSISRGSWLR